MQYSQMLNKIILGDCLEIMKHIPDDSVDMVLCDLPYGTTALKWDSVIPFESLWAQYERIVKPNAAMVFTASQPFTTSLISSNPKLYRYNWVWKKTRPSNFPLAKKQPMKYHEDIVVFGKKSPKYYPVMVDGGNRRKKKGTNDGYKGFEKGLERPDYLEKVYKDFYPSSIIEFPNPNHNLSHPTQKPVELFEYLIKTYTHENDTVLDNCIGSGTTAEAALRTNRQFIGIEQNEQYWKIACERIDKFRELNE